jgi:hypothetical protein
LEIITASAGRRSQLPRVSREHSYLGMHEPSIFPKYGQVRGEASTGEFDMVQIWCASGDVASTTCMFVTQLTAEFSMVGGTREVTHLALSNSEKSYL